MLVIYVLCFWFNERLLKNVSAIRTVRLVTLKITITVVNKASHLLRPYLLALKNACLLKVGTLMSVGFGPTTHEMRKASPI